MKIFMTWMDKVGKMHTVTIPDTMDLYEMDAVANRIIRQWQQNQDFCFFITSNREQVMAKGRRELSAGALDWPVLRGKKKRWFALRRN